MQIAPNVFSNFLFKNINVLDNIEIEIDEFVKKLNNNDFLTFFNFLTEENYKEFIKDWSIESESEDYYKSIIKDAISFINSENEKIGNNVVKLQRNKKEISIKTLNNKVINLDNLSSFESEMESNVRFIEKLHNELNDLESFMNKRHLEQIELINKKEKANIEITNLYNPYVKIIKVGNNISNKEYKPEYNIQMYVGINFSIIMAYASHFKEVLKVKGLINEAKKKGATKKEVVDNVELCAKNLRFIATVNEKINLINKDLFKADQQKLEIKKSIEGFKSVNVKYEKDIELLHKKHKELQERIEEESGKILEANPSTLLSLIKVNLSDLFFHKVYVDNKEELIQKMLFFAKEKLLDVSYVEPFIDLNKDNFRLVRLLYSQKEKLKTLMNDLCLLIKQAKSWFVKEENFNIMVDSVNISKVFENSFFIIINQFETIYQKSKEYFSFIEETQQYFSNTKQIEIQYFISKLYELSLDKSNKMLYIMLGLPEDEIKKIEELNEFECEKKIDFSYNLAKNITFLGKDFDSWLREVIVMQKQENKK